MKFRKIKKDPIQLQEEIEMDLRERIVILDHKIELLADVVNAQGMLLRAMLGQLGGME
jgi:hypothetical protein